MRRGVLPTIRPLNVNPLYWSEKPRHGRKIAISEVSCEDHVGDCLRLARRNPQRIYSGGLKYQCSVLLLLNRIRLVRPGTCESGTWFLLHNNAQSNNATIIKQFLAQRKVTVLDHPPYSPDLARGDYFCSQK